MLHDRRSFLALLGAAVTDAYLSGCTSTPKPPRRGVVIGNMKGRKPGSDQLLYALVLIDLDSGKQQQIPLEFFGHGFAVDPRNTNRAMLFEKKGPGAGELDLKTGTFVRRLVTTAERAFYGHGVFSSDGALLFVTENVLATKQGLVSVWDGRTLAALGEFPTYGLNPHDCLLIDGGKTLVVTNGGGDAAGDDLGSVCFIDIASRKLLERMPITAKAFNAGHVAVSREGHVVAVSAPREGLPEDGLGAISFGDRKASLETATAPAAAVAKMQGEVLSLCIHEQTRRVAVTCPKGKQFSVWDLSGQRLLKEVVGVPSPRGVTLTVDGQYFVLSYGERGALAFYSTTTLEVASAMEVAETGLSGSHIYTWSRS